MPGGTETGLVADREDNRILLAAFLLQKKGKRVFFVSKDINARVKATSLGIKAVDYEKQKVDIKNLYQGYVEQTVSTETIVELKASGRMQASAASTPISSSN